MTHPLTLTLKIKQDQETLTALQKLKDDFANGIQQKIEEALRESELVHFARVVVIHDQYIQVITEYDGSHREYTEFFRDALTPIFAAIFSLAEDVPDVTDPDRFFEFAKNANIRTLGRATDESVDMDGNVGGWLFSAYNHRSVEELLPLVNKE